MRALLAHPTDAARQHDKRVLRRLGFNVWVCVSGKSVLHSLAVARNASFAFDLFVLGGEMPPGPSGAQILDDLREKGNETPIVLFTPNDVFGWQSWPANATVLHDTLHEKLEQAVRELLPALGTA